MPLKDWPVIVGGGILLVSITGLALASLNLHYPWFLKALAAVHGMTLTAWVLWVNETAQAIEARRAETGTGSVHESAVAESDAP